MVELITQELRFPSVHTANEDGLVAVGGDLSPERILLAYREGIFPWPLFDFSLMTWFSPDPRAILEFDDFHIGRTMKRILRQGRFRVSFDTCFEDVVIGCAAPGPGRPSTWITQDIFDAYSELFRRGYGHSVEVWSSGRLVGGLYGLSIGGLFAGESMFSRETNASKVALAHLVHRLRKQDFALFDIQQSTDHMQSLGASELPRKKYLTRLKSAVALDRSFGPPGPSDL